MEENFDEERQWVKKRGRDIRDKTRSKSGNLIHVGCFDALFREGKGTWQGIRDSRTLQKKIPLPSQRTTLATRDKSRGDGRGKRKNLETRAEVDNNKRTKREREREYKQINKRTRCK